MKNARTKMLGVTLITAMLIGNGQVLASHCTGIQAEFYSDEYATETAIGVELDISLSAEDNDLDLYSFVAPASGVYSVKINEWDINVDATPYVSVRDDEYNYLAGNDGETYSDPEDNYYYDNTDYFTVELSEGERYYLCCWTAEEDAAADYSVIINCGSDLNGWSGLSGNWIFYSNGVAYTGWHRINGRWYFFNDRGIMQTGWLKSPGNGKWYYLHPSSGYMMSDCWVSSSTMWYYIGSDGLMVTGWKQIDGKWYYFNPEGGYMVKHWIMVGGSWYYFNPNGGAMVTGWQQLSGSWYYMNASGAMETGWQKIGNTWYYFYSSGKMATGSVQIGSKTYQFASNGAWIPG